MADDIPARVAELETRIAFQEQALTDLSDALASARVEETSNALLLHRMLEELRQMRMALSAQSHGNEPSSEPPPPHY